MALDPSLANNIDPNVWNILVEFDARLSALENAPTVFNDPPVEHIMKWADGVEAIWDLRQSS